MKYIVFIVLLLVFQQCFATDFSIPQSPAFNLAQFESEATLDASASKEIMLSTKSSFPLNDANHSIWGLEYNFDKQFELPISISFATNTIPDRIYAVGFRYDICNKISISENQYYQSLQEKVEEINRHNSELFDILLNDLGSDSQNKQAVYKKYKGLIELLLNQININTLDSLLAESNKEFENITWSENILTIAGAASFISPDNSLSGITFQNSSYQLWGVYNLRLSNSMQLNLNLTALHKRVFDFDSTSFGGGLTFKYGTNSLKGRAEASMFAQKDDKLKIEMNIGAEFRLLTNYWCIAKLVYDAKKEKLIPTLEMKIGL